ncbi:reverse transcriptase domain-containing protein, partial [Klebsiella pneumoniae]|nr:reverse transcriptase domain-containing protein [Klebsiella pneumoniae]
DYVDDLLAKSSTRAEHLSILTKIFDRLEKFQVRLNPKKCVFGVTSGKLLGYIVLAKGIEVDPTKVQAIMDMPPPQN